MIKKVWLTAIMEISLALIILFSGSMSYAGEMADAPAVFEEQALWLDPGKSDASAGADYDSAGDAAVKDVIDRIAALPDPDKISLIYREYIDKAKDALNKLSPEDQARVPETARKKLAADDEAVKKLELAEDKKNIFRITLWSRSLMPKKHMRQAVFSNAAAPCTRYFRAGM